MAWVVHYVDDGGISGVETLFWCAWSDPENDARAKPLLMQAEMLTGAPCRLCFVRVVMMTRPNGYTVAIADDTVIAPNRTPTPPWVVDPPLDRSCRQATGT